MLHFPHFSFISAMVGPVFIFVGHYFIFVGIIYLIGAEKAASGTGVTAMLGLRP